MWRRFSEEERQTIWDMREAGVPVKRIARHLGRQPVSLRKFLSGTGGKRPSARERSELRLSLQEREEISRGLAAGDSIRAIAASLGRSPSTVCREVNANGGRKKYRALVADRAACQRALRPKRAKLAQCRRLRGVVERKLEARWSPQQISAWLALEYPDRPEMQVSHETIYQSLFVQSRGALRKELHSAPAQRPGHASAQGLRQGEPHRAGQAQEHGDDLRATGRSEGPGRARPLGGRPDLRQEDDRRSAPWSSATAATSSCSSSPTATAPRRCAEP